VNLQNARCNNRQFLSSQFNLHMLWSWITLCKAQKKTLECLSWLQFQMCHQEYSLGNTVHNSVYIFVAFNEVEYDDFVLALPVSTRMGLHADHGFHHWWFGFECSCFVFTLFCLRLPTSRNCELIVGEWIWYACVSCGMKMS
jgi:hypothetical protein